MHEKKANIKEQRVKVPQCTGCSSYVRMLLCPRLFVLLYTTVFLTGSFCQASLSAVNPAGRVDKAAAPGAKKDGLDPAKYITIDEVRPGMEAYCLTEYEGTKIEKFDLEVLSVVRNMMPGRDAILVQGTDERFIRTGPVAGCSGSPVYIDGRLAGALAFAWVYSKDPLYGVTPIEAMLRVGKQKPGTTGGVREPGFVFDFSQPIDFARINAQIAGSTNVRKNSSAGLATLPCPLITSGLPAGVCEQLNTAVEPFGLMAVSGLGGSTETSGQEDTQLAPGATLAVPLVTGDITMTVIGTVTAVVGDKVYGFGHGFLGYGPINWPMAPGRVHTVVSSLVRSFKSASALETVGALTRDESTAVFGQIGAKAEMIPLKIKVDRYNDVEKRVYNCQVAVNRRLTPLLLRSAVAGAALMLGDLPPDHTIEYKVTISVEDGESIAFENVSTSLGVNEMITESVGSVALLMNNPYKKVCLKSIEVDIQEVAKNILSHIWSVDLSDSKVKAGQNIDVEVVVESFLAGKKKYLFNLTVPEDLSPGKYDLILCGGYEYLAFLRKSAPYKFVAQNLTTLIKAINDILAIKRNRLYCLLVLPSGGVTLEKAELPDLPATKALILQDAKRTLRTQPYPHWLEKSLETGTVVIDKKNIRITVEK